jgi:uncharacterized protein YraI
MVRRIAAVALALTLNPMLLYAQDAVLTVTVASGDVYKGPSTVTPVIGHASRGTALPVTRNLGSWAKVAWIDSPDGIGYVHVTMGRLSSSNGAAPAGASSAPSAAPLASSSASAAMSPAPRTAAREHTSSPTHERMAISGGPTDAPITHIVGLGGLVASRSSFGATARAWRTDHLGIQLAIARDALSSDVAAGRVTSVRLEPGIVYGLFDHVSDYVWIRPYVGSVVSFRHDTLRVSAPAALEPVSDNSIGYRVFGGSELTFAGLPRFGVSAELGYRRFSTPFPAFEADRFTVSIAGHWYIK